MHKDVKKRMDELNRCTHFRISDEELEKHLAKQHAEKIARWKKEGVDHSVSEYEIAKKYNLLIHP